ncbi:tetratricopeptide repeat protein [Thiorhodococcus minor]|uniref:Tetratricopeptide repeat protein n=1 Tax=Thiorhodococcus minor TaxID=57489 RepID=A0A6M0K5X7_9GAMM|nr:tetratricopeptide repeat protein [Thiorhodococcus minor]NEV64829.1 hypothetical protein [Thiorhodococcus minor]
MRSRARWYVLTAAFFLLCGLAYWPGLYGPFLFDDYSNILDNERLTSIEDFRIASIQTAISQEEPGPLGRPVSFVSFALNIAATGLDPYWFKVTNLAIHLLSGLALLALLRVLSRTLFDAPRPSLIAAISLATCAAWLLHPINVTSVLYVVQRMAELSALFALLAMLLYSLARQRQMEGRPGATLFYAGLAVTFLLAIFSKENGILIPGYLFLIEIVFFRFRAGETRVSHSLKWLYLSGAALAVPVVILAFLHYGASYQIRDFTIEERLLTQARVLWFYVQSILVPDIRSMAIFHDDVAISRSLLEPATTLISILGLAAALIAGVTLRRRAPVLSFGILFFLLSHAMESTFLPLEMIHEHRNYLGSWGLLWPVFFYLFVLADRHHRLLLASAVSLLLIAVLAAGTRIRAGYWGNELLLAEYQAHHHPASFRTLISAGTAYSGYGEATGNPDLLRKSLDYYRRAHELDPQASNVLVSIISLSVILGQGQEITDFEHKLKDNLVRQPIGNETTNAFVMVSRCLSEDGCVFPQRLYRKMTEAMLRNPRLEEIPTNAAKVYSASSNFAYLDGDLELAIHYGEQALRLHPTDLQYWLNQAILLKTAGRDAEARDHLERAKAIDGTHYAAARIETVERQLMTDANPASEDGDSP